MAISKFLRLFMTNAAEPLTGAVIWLVPQANSYPTGAILLNPHSTRQGTYEADGVAHGEYKIYIGEGSSPTLYTEHIWTGENFISIIADGFDISTGKLTTAGLSDGAVTEVKLATNSVSTNKIVDSSVTSAKVATGAVTETKLADASVTANKLGLYSISTDKLSEGAVTTDKIRADAVTTDKIEAGSVTENKLGAGSVTNSKLGTYSVTSYKIEDGAINSDKILSGSVITSSLANSAVTTAKLADDSVTKDKLNANCAGDGLTVDIAGAIIPSLYQDHFELNMYTSEIMLKDDSITKAKINADIAGNGLVQNVTGALEVNADGTSLVISSDVLKLNRKEIIGILSFSGGGRSFITILNTAGVTVSLSQADTGIYSLTVSSAILLTGKTIAFIQPQNAIAEYIGIRRHSDTVLRIDSIDQSSSGIDLAGDFYIHISIFP